MFERVLAGSLNDIVRLHIRRSLPPHSQELGTERAEGDRQSRVWRVQVHGCRRVVFRLAGGCEHIGEHSAPCDVQRSPTWYITTHCMQPDILAWRGYGASHSGLFPRAARRSQAPRRGRAPDLPGALRAAELRGRGPRRAHRGCGRCGGCARAALREPHGARRRHHAAAVPLNVRRRCVRARERARGLQPRPRARAARCRASG